MILKVRTADGSWKYYEGFYSAKVSTVWCHDNETVACDEFHKAANKVVAGVQAGAPAAVGSGENKVTVVNLSYPADQIIAFDTEGYLLNYEGKTIERL